MNREHIIFFKMNSIDNPETLMGNIKQWLINVMGLRVSMNTKMSRLLVKGKGLKEGYQLVFYHDILQTYKHLLDAKLQDGVTKYRALKQCCQDNFTTQALSISAIDTYKMGNEHQFLDPLQTYLMVNYGIMIGNVLITEGTLVTIRYLDELMK